MMSNQRDRSVSDRLKQDRLHDRGAAVYLLRPGRTPEFLVIPSPIKLEALQELVGGYIEAVRLGDGLVALVDEEGLLKNLPRSLDIEPGNGTVVPVCGPVLVLGEDGEDFVGLQSSDIARLAVCPPWVRR